ncbi:MAG: Pvc16 family protein [Candidatus Thiodiazotropha sp. L084R]
MALVDSRNAIGALGELLQGQLLTNTSIPSVDVGRVASAVQQGSGPKFNLFLYQLSIDAHLRNHPLDEGQSDPLWMIAHYLLTAFDINNDSDTIEAHEYLGAGMLALQEFNFKQPASAALADNPEPLKITFDQADAELISKLMQGSNETYRLSMAFQVRPIMIVPGELPGYAPLVHSVGPPEDEGVMVLPTLGPRLTSVEPQRFDVGPTEQEPVKQGVTLFLRGQDLSSAIQWVCLSDSCYPVTAAPSGELHSFIPATTTLSPGSHPITVAQDLPSGRRSVSNALVVELLPTLASATLNPAVVIVDGESHRELSLSGTCLGGPDDNIFVNFWRDGAVAMMLEAKGVATGESLSLQVPLDAPLSTGPYQLILRVNGSQAAASPEVEWP